MKKALISCLIAVFMVSASSPVLAGGRDQGPATGILVLAGAVILGIGSLFAFTTNRKAGVVEKAIEADVIKATLDSNVTDGTIDYGRVKDKSGNEISRLDVDDLTRSGYSRYQYQDPYRHPYGRYDY